MKNLKKKGFTLIELMVVLSIISLLTSISLTSLSKIRQKSRDAKRVADIKNVALALDLYHTVNGSYPNNNREWTTAALETALVPAYLKALPKDPMNGWIGYSSNGVDYAFLYMSADIDYPSQPDLLDRQRDGGPNGCKLDGTTYTGWKYYSTDDPNNAFPAWCW